MGHGPPRPACLAALLALVSIPTARADTTGCRADLNADSATNILDFVTFLNAYAAADTRADVNNDGLLNPADFAAYLTLFAAAPAGCPQAQLPWPVVFVSRAINDQGAACWLTPRDLPGVGPHSRTRPAAPGKLLIRKPDGSLQTLIDGAAPSPATLSLIDVNAPAVSYSAQVIAFAGLPAGSNYNATPNATVAAWRIYTIRTDGSDLRQVTFTDLHLTYDQFGAAAPLLKGYDDFDPVFLPDGRICFSSTRFPQLAQFDNVRASNLYVVDVNGEHLHRITAERNAAERPAIDPATGHIIYTRWWRNHRLPSDDLSTLLVNPADPTQGYIRHAGLTTDPAASAPGMSRRAWHLAEVRTDGSGIRAWSLSWRDETANHAYAPAIGPAGAYAAFFPSATLTDAAGFGGIRRIPRSPAAPSPVIGVTDLSGTPIQPCTTILNGDYAADPEPLPDGRILLSWAPTIHQDYGLYTVSADGSNLSRLLDLRGTSELRARIIAPRPIAPMERDVYRDAGQPYPEPLPPAATVPFTGPAFTFYSFNVYYNAPVDWDIVSAPAVGSARSMRFYMDPQRTSPSSSPALDWPVLVAESPVEPAGNITQDHVPADIPIFEQLRDAQHRVPATGGPFPQGVAHVAGLNFSPAGSSATCVGCHTGHSTIPHGVEAAELKFTNLAPGAAVSVSSARTPESPRGLIDRQVLKGDITRYWTSTPGETTGQWARLVFPVPVTLRTIRLYDPRPEASCSLHVLTATIRLYSDDAGHAEITAVPTGPLSVSGTAIPFPETLIRSLRIELDSVSGLFEGQPAAGLAEIEVIARGEAP